MLTAQTRMEDLEDKLRQYNHHYYALAESLVSDDVYRIIKNEGKSAIMVTHDISDALSIKVLPLKMI